MVVAAVEEVEEEEVEVAQVHLTPPDPPRKRIPVWYKYQNRQKFRLEVRTGHAIRSIRSNSTAGLSASN